MVEKGEAVLQLRGEFARISNGEKSVNIGCAAGVATALGLGRGRNYRIFSDDQTTKGHRILLTRKESYGSPTFYREECYISSGSAREYDRRSPSWARRRALEYFLPAAGSVALRFVPTQK